MRRLKWKREIGHKRSVGGVPKLGKIGGWNWRITSGDFASRFLCITRARSRDNTHAELTYKVNAMKCGNLTDGQLLKQFAADQSNRDAFDQIVRRDWQMVYQNLSAPLWRRTGRRGCGANVFMALADRAS